MLQRINQQQILDPENQLNYIAYRRKSNSKNKYRFIVPKKCIQSSSTDKFRNIHFRHPQANIHQHSSPIKPKIVKEMIKNNHHKSVKMFERSSFNRQNKIISKQKYDGEIILSSNYIPEKSASIKKKLKKIRFENNMIARQNFDNKQEKVKLIIQQFKKQPSPSKLITKADSIKQITQEHQIQKNNQQQNTKEIHSTTVNLPFQKVIAGAESNQIQKQYKLSFKSIIEQSLLLENHEQFLLQQKQHISPQMSEEIQNYQSISQQFAKFAKQELCFNNSPQKPTQEQRKSHKNQQIAQNLEDSFINKYDELEVQEIIGGHYNIQNFEVNLDQDELYIDNQKKFLSQSFSQLIKSKNSTQNLDISTSKDNKSNSRHSSKAKKHYNMSADAIHRSIYNTPLNNSISLAKIKIQGLKKDKSKNSFSKVLERFRTKIYQ